MLIEELPALLRILTDAGVEASPLDNALKLGLPLPIKSTVFRAARYAPGDGTLTVTFRNGRTYTYENVPISTAIGFASADSQGAYYDEQIKGQY